MHCIQFISRKFPVVPFSFIFFCFCFEWKQSGRKKINLCNSWLSSFNLIYSLASIGQSVNVNNTCVQHQKSKWSNRTAAMYKHFNRYVVRLLWWQPPLRFQLLSMKCRIAFDRFLRRWDTPVTSASIFGNTYMLSPRGFYCSFFLSLFLSLRGLFIVCSAPPMFSIHCCHTINAHPDTIQEYLLCGKAIQSFNFTLFVALIDKSTI